MISLKIILTQVDGEDDNDNDCGDQYLLDHFQMMKWKTVTAN